MCGTWYWLDEKRIMKSGYCVFVKRLEVECTDPMFDTRSYKWGDEAELVISPFIRNYCGRLIAHPDNNGSLHIRSCDLKMLNRIWYNIKHQDFTFEQLKNIFGEDAQ